VWKHPVNDPESSPAFGDDGAVYVGAGFNGNAVVALRSESDEELKAKGLKREIWRVQAPYPMTGPITVDGDLVIAGGGNSDFVYADPKPDGVVMAINRKDGSVKWQTPMGDAVLNRIVVRDGRVYCPVRSGHVTALSLADGKPIWKQPVSGNQPVVAGVELSADGQIVFAVAKDGILALLKAADGSIIQTPNPDKTAEKKMLDERHKLNAEGKESKGLCFSTPTLAGNRLLVGSETGGLRCFEVLGGSKGSDK
jgi:outer membrane protein assembly factor BamB